MNDLNSAKEAILAAKFPEDVFGLPPEPYTSDALAAHIKTEYRRLASMVHPDKFPEEEHLAATQVFARLSQLKIEAEVAIVSGLYGKKRAPAVPKARTVFPLEIKTKSDTYTLTGLVANGSIADIYDAGDRVVKVARNAGDNDLLANEAKVLRELYPLAQPEVEFFRYLPKLFDSFTLRGKSGAPRAVNVISRRSGMVTLAEVQKAYPDGLDFRDVVWMWKRCLSALGFIHNKGFVHGSMTADHILVHPTEHGAKIVDWCYAVKIGGKIKAADSKAKAIAPPELLEKRPASEGTDIWMLHKTIATMLNADAPKKIHAFINGCLIKNPALRPSDAFGLHEELSDLLFELVGKPQYRPLAMPATP